MKRSASSKAKATPRAKKPRNEAPEYHLTPSVRDDETGEIIWPAPKAQIEQARSFIRDCVAAKEKTLIAPDKDADGLSSGVILYKTLLLLGLPEDLITVHLLAKGHSIHDESERAAMTAVGASYVFVLDQGSTAAPPVVDGPHRALVIDHHWAPEDGDRPAGAERVTACCCPPVATSAMLTHHICAALHGGVAAACDWLCVVGAHGDLGNALKWEPPLPDMRATFKAHTKKALNEAVALVNAPRRAAAHNVRDAWSALAAASGPRDLLDEGALRAARAEVRDEVRRCTRAPPSFSADGRVAVLRVRSPAQVHPVIATRWAGMLGPKRLEVVLAANDGYLPGQVHFSCRVARRARAREGGGDGGAPPVNIMAVLEEIAARAPDPTLRERLGAAFARGHREASGGVVTTEAFEEFIAVLELKSRSKKGAAGGASDGIEGTPEGEKGASPTT
ncbi:DHH family protein [Durotheca rogersii]|uniref:DHH family protein n=1 Tax=Durotheca rogersii TaxID=419775 RepID=UPI00221EC204|nr:DHH family protein [Durotheca rogersii]KAI5868361.1 DHH family protein [Durotheca rogersii]